MHELRAQNISNSSVIWTNDDVMIRLRNKYSRKIMEKKRNETTMTYDKPYVVNSRNCWARASQNATTGDYGEKKNYALTVWLTPHINTLSSGSFARNSLTFWCFTRKCFFFSLLSPLDISGALDILATWPAQLCHTAKRKRRVCHTVSR